MRSAFVFRHPSWFNEPCLQALTDNHAAIVLADRPGDRYHPIFTADWTYVRFHKGTPRSSSYPMAKLARWADRLRNLGVAEGFIYFNNDEGGAAPRDILEDRLITAERGHVRDAEAHRAGTDYCDGLAIHGVNP